MKSPEPKAHHLPWLMLTLTVWVLGWFPLQALSLSQGPLSSHSSTIRESDDFE